MYPTFEDVRLSGSLLAVILLHFIYTLFGFLAHVTMFNLILTNDVIYVVCIYMGMIISNTLTMNDYVDTMIKNVNFRFICQIVTKWNVLLLY